MRLLFVHDQFGAMAGAEVNIWLTAGELKQRGHAVGILHGPPTGKAEENWRVLFDQRFSLENGSQAHAVVASVTAFKPDAIYIHKMSDPAVLAALLQSGRPVARMVHDHDLYCMRSYKYFPLTRAICTRPATAYCVFPCGASLARSRNGGLPFRWVSYLAKRKEIRLNQRFHRLIVATDYMKQELLRNGFELARIEIHAPVPRTAEVTVEASFSERNLIVYAGQIIRGKGVDELLRALARVQVDFECAILGEGSHKSFCQQLAGQLGLEERVFFQGYIAPEEMPHYYAQASVAVVSSLWPEPFGAVGLEAMRYGLPVVAFDAGGIREWLHDGENGFLVPWRDRTQFAAKLQQLLRDKSLARSMGRCGRQLVRDKYNFNDYISGLEAMFERLVTNHKS